MVQSLRVQISEITQSLRLCEMTKAAHNCMEVLLLQRAKNMQNAISQLFLSCIKELQLVQLLKSKAIQVFYLSCSQQLIYVCESDSRAEVKGLSLAKQSYSRMLNLHKTET